jgi:hypothetical protein
MHAIALPVSLLVLLTSACTYSWPNQHYLGADRYELARVQRPDGGTDSYVLSFDSNEDGRLELITATERAVGGLGLSVAELDQDAAQRRGVRPYTGLLVEKVAAKSGAETAGILAGDVLLTVAGTEVVYAPQLEALEAKLPGGQQVAVKILRGQSEMALSIDPRLQKQAVTERQTIELEAMVPGRPHAGVVLRGIPAATCERIYGTPRNAIVITGIEVGSPAWLAGFRTGDVIDAVDGGPVPPLADLTRTIRERGSRGESMRWRTSRGNRDGHEAEIALSDYSGTEKVHFPLVFCVEDGVQRDSWTIGPWGMIAGNRNTYIADANNREAGSENVFSAVLGLFRLKTTPDSTTLRLLWFIKIQV